MNSPPQKIYRVGLAPLYSPKEFLEYKIVLASTLEEAVNKITLSVSDFATRYEIRQVVLVDIVDIP